jgi:predicted translin family RNA/ssDNA-binding protein
MKKPTNLKKKIKDNQKQVEKLKDRLVKDSRELFKVSCKEIFENNPGFKSFSWTQYTPYFNDGDSCEFSAHTDYVYIDDEDEESDFHNAEIDFKEVKQKEKTIKNLLSEIDNLKNQGKKEDDWEIRRNLGRIEKLNKLSVEDAEKRFNFLKDISDLLSSIDQDTLETMFGDHAKVIVSKDEINVEHYDHD